MLVKFLSSIRCFCLAWSCCTALLCFALTVRGDVLEKDGGFEYVRIVTPSELNREAVFWYRLPLGSRRLPHGILLLVPGYNGDGRGMLAEGGVWARFADEHALVLVGPTFKTTVEENHSRRGYYYPELWSGAATLKALAEIRRRAGIACFGDSGADSKVLIFGFSAGAHFAHRFALWRPGAVQAFVAYSAAWWDAPTPALRGTPGLIMCGEADERFEASFAFFAEGRRLGLPLVWRGYAGVGHELKPQVLKMAQAFLEHYAQEAQGGRRDAGSLKAANSKFVGDIQSYRYFEAGSAEAERIPMESRVELPSRKIAETWAEEP